ncbi:MAG: oligosaccharide flippase family protein, partial [Anaerolineae bacterium]|nr:oligosaccharide flippase family protein [Anaerolineae bacterium]
MSDNLAQRSVRSVTWNILESGITTALNLAQFVILARLLPVETFGIYASANATVTLVFSVAYFGLGGAFLYRTPETEDIERASATMFTLKLILTILFGILLLSGILIFADPQQSELRIALLVVTATTALNHQAHTAQSILVRRVQHGRLAILSTVEEVLATSASIGLALSGVTLWALLIRNIITPVVNLVGLYVWRPVWRPRLSWDPAGMRYFLSFGFRTMVTQWLYTALDNLDDIWTGAFLGSESLGFYSRAYRLARMPSVLITGPVSNVAGGTYAELKDQRKTLSSAFILTNLAMVRSGFFLAGVIALIAPEVVALLLGEKWLPMVGAFQLMLIYALFEPMKRTISNLYLS